MWVNSQRPARLLQRWQRPQPRRRTCWSPRRLAWRRLCGWASSGQALSPKAFNIWVRGLPCPVRFEHARACAETRDRPPPSVLDEADMLLSFGHEEDVASIAAKLGRGVQCMLVSATCRCVTFSCVCAAPPLLFFFSFPLPRYPFRPLLWAVSWFKGRAQRYQKFEAS